MKYSVKLSIVRKIILATALTGSLIPSAALAAESQNPCDMAEYSENSTTQYSLASAHEAAAAASESLIAAQNKYTEYKSVKERLETAASEARTEIAKGSAGFFESCYEGDTQGSDYAVSLLTYRLKEYNPAGAAYTTLGAPGDATSLENMRIALERMSKINDIRNKLGQSELLITDSQMAIAQVRGNYSINIWGHMPSNDTPYSASEDLAWNWSDPYEGWYDQEKQYFDEATLALYNRVATSVDDVWSIVNSWAISDEIDSYVSGHHPGHVTGHYLNIISPSTKYYSCAYATSSSSFVDVLDLDSQTVGDKAYTYTEYRARFDAYYDALLEPINALAQAENDLAQAESELSEAQAAKEEADAALASAEEAAAAESLRIAGETRYETSQAISAAGFDSAKHVVIASGENYPDALAASSLAGVYDAPVLLTDPDKLSPYIVDEIERLGAGDIIIVGGEAAVSKTVEDELANRYVARGFRLSRIAGETRQRTATEIAERLAAGYEGDHAIEWGDTCIVASGDSYADALAASPYAFAKLAPIFLTESDGSISFWTAEAIKDLGFKHVIMVGGEARVSKKAESTLNSMRWLESVTRIAGETRYETAAKMAQLCVDAGMSYDGAAVASGENYPDAIAGGALCGKRGSVMLLAGKTDEDSAFALDAIAANKASIKSANVLGGSSAVSDEFAIKMATALGEL